MTRTRRLLNAILLLVALGASEWARSASSDESPGGAEARTLRVDDEFFAKGGLGIVNTEVYLDLRSRRNELVLRDGVRWTGRERDSSQVVILWKNLPMVADEIPADFELRKSIVISFERARVTFVDFQSDRGGFYRRQPTP